MSTSCTRVRVIPKQQQQKVIPPKPRTYLYLFLYVYLIKSKISKNVFSRPKQFKQYYHATAFLTIFLSFYLIPPPPRSVFIECVFCCTLYSVILFFVSVVVATSSVGMSPIYFPLLIYSTTTYHNKGYHFVLRCVCTHITISHHILVPFC